MAKVDVLIEVPRQQPEAFALFHAAMESEIESLQQGEDLVAHLTGMGLEVLGEFAPVPMFAENMVYNDTIGFATFAALTENLDTPSETVVVACQVEWSQLDVLRGRQDVKVFPNSPLTLFT